MRRLFVILTSILFYQGLMAQEVPLEDETSAVADSIPILNRVNVNQDPRLDKMLSWHIENNKKRDGIEGYRVEIFFSSALNAKERAFEEKVDFLNLFPDYNVHIKFAAPNFKVRVGDFRTKNEALKLQKTIEDDYPGAFIVPDIIEFPLLKQEKYERPN